MYGCAVRAAFAALTFFRRAFGEPEKWCPQRDSNPRYGLERAVTLTASRWGPAAQSSRVTEVRPAWLPYLATMKHGDLSNPISPRPFETCCGSAEPQRHVPFEQLIAAAERGPNTNFERASRRPAGGASYSPPLNAGQRQL